MPFFLRVKFSKVFRYAGEKARVGAQAWAEAMVRVGPGGGPGPDLVPV